MKKRTLSSKSCGKIGIMDKTMKYKNDSITEMVEPKNQKITNPKKVLAKICKGDFGRCKGDFGPSTWLSTHSSLTGKASERKLMQFQSIYSIQKTKEKKKEKPKKTKKKSLAETVIMDRKGKGKRSDMRDRSEPKTKQKSNRHKSKKMSLNSKSLSPPNKHHSVHLQDKITPFAKCRGDSRHDLEKLSLGESSKNHTENLKLPKNKRTKSNCFLTPAFLKGAPKKGKLEVSNKKFTVNSAQKWPTMEESTGHYMFSQTTTVPLKLEAEDNGKIQPPPKLSGFTPLSSRAMPSQIEKELNLIASSRQYATNENLKTQTKQATPLQIIPAMSLVKKVHIKSMAKPAIERDDFDEDLPIRTLSSKKASEIKEKEHMPTVLKEKTKEVPEEIENQLFRKKLSFAHLSATKYFDQLPSESPKVRLFDDSFDHLRLTKSKSHTQGSLLSSNGCGQTDINFLLSKMLESEITQRHRGFNRNQLGMSGEMRCYTVDRLSRAVRELNYSRSTFFAAVHLFDLNSASVSLDDCPALSVACLLEAAETYEAELADCQDLCVLFDLEFGSESINEVDYQRAKVSLLSTAPKGRYSVHHVRLGEPPRSPLGRVRGSLSQDFCRAQLPPLLQEPATAGHVTAL